MTAMLAETRVDSVPAKRLANGAAYKVKSKEVTAKGGSKKSAVITPTSSKSDRIAIYVAITTAISTVLLSMLLNVWAFTAGNPGFFGVVIGILLPLWTLALTFLGQHFHQKNKYVSWGSYALAAFVLIVSLPHLASGYSLLGDQSSGAHIWNGWCLAVVTDIAQILCKAGCISIVTKKGA